MSDWSALEYIKAAIFYFSYFVPLAAAFFAIAAVRASGLTRALAAAGFAAASLFIYARFVEPRILLTVEHETMLARCFADAGEVRIAIFSDMHVGMFKNAMPIARIARRADATGADLVLIPGDFVYFLTPQNYAQTFAAFGAMATPVYAVLGNHDLGLPGPDVRTSLADALSEIGVVMIDDLSIAVQTQNAHFQLIGLSDKWGRNQHLELLADEFATPKIALTHNPGTVLELTPMQRADLMVSGHTHGGQVFIPGLTCKITSFACAVTRYGLADVRNGRVFVTSGTGMVGLPIRFNVPPRIDVLTVKWRACE
ncbi:MAG: metallophosphoesterase [Parvularculaceae bacterium]|nr:metallophosphoesterase [Parvularculaceae bacterium]